MGVFSCLCSMLFSTDLQPLSGIFNTFIARIFDCAVWASMVFLIYLFFRVTLPWYLKLEGVRTTCSLYLDNQHHTADTDTYATQTDQYSQNNENNEKNQINQINQNHTITQHNHHRRKVHFTVVVKDKDDNSKHITDLFNARHGEQLFINGYLQGHRDGKKGKEPLYTQSDSWKEAGEEALEHIRQSFVHDEEELRRAMSGR